MVEDLQREIVLIRSDHDGKHDHLVNLLDTLLTGQATERVASSTNAVNIQLLAKDHDRLAAQLARESTASFDHLSKIEAFEKKIDTFLLGELSDDTPSEHSIAEIAMPALIMTELEPPRMPFSPELLNPISQSFPSESKPVFHDGSSSLASKVVPDTAFSFMISFKPVDSNLSQIQLTSLSTRAVFIWAPQEDFNLSSQKNISNLFNWNYASPRKLFDPGKDPINPLLFILSC
jgi:hypothetical protein